jgi:hypothetical protein
VIQPLKSVRIRTRNPDREAFVYLLSGDGGADLPALVVDLAQTQVGENKRKIKVCTAPKHRKFTHMLTKKSMASSWVADPVTMVRQFKEKAKITFWNTCSFFFILFDYPVPYFSHEMNDNLFIVTVSKDENFTKKSRMILCVT